MNVILICYINVLMQQALFDLLSEQNDDLSMLIKPIEVGVHKPCRLNEAN